MVTASTSRTDFPNTLTQDVLEERAELGPSTRGGWRPIFGMSSLDVIDWFCPHCKRAIDSNITGVHRCWRCGLVVKDYPEKPEYHQPTNQERLRRWRVWWNRQEIE